MADQQDIQDFKQAFMHNLYSMRGQDENFATPNDYYMTLAYTVRDQLMERWRRTVQTYFETNPKTVYYLSAEYLPGRQLMQNLISLDAVELAREALAELGLSLNELRAQETEPGLGNGGLGRLGACFLDSMATLGIPNVGYGIRYEFGIFRQTFEDGWQVERPDDWLYFGNPWEFPHPDDMVEVKFGGYTESYVDDIGRYRVRWLPERTVLGIPYHTMVPGYDTTTVNTLRLWRARASKQFDFQVFNAGDFSRAVAQKTASENISKVLYPNDNTPQGKKLRLEQQYFFVACSLQDILRNFLAHNSDWTDFPEKVTIQLNDTHPSVAIAELMRLLVDEHELAWERAWDITRHTFASTQHTLLPEALERWPVHLFEELLPRHMEIIYEINHRFLEKVREVFPGDEARVARMSLIQEWPEKAVRMANLACVGSYAINGVSELQTNLLKTHVFKDFYELGSVSDVWPQKFNNKTNGVSPRRFMRIANPRLSALITSTIGEGWLTDLSQLEKLEAFVEDPDFRRQWHEVKQRNKKELADYVFEQQTLAGVANPTAIDPTALFDILVKRIHEYKRQLLKILHIITLYNRIKDHPNIDMVPRVCIFGGKAAPGYQMAKLIIKLINAVAQAINNDPDVRDRLKVVFITNFNVTVSQHIYPAADVSEQISMAGKEASGTGNMKFALNGALTSGTLDGANIEIRELVGHENFFLFGLTADEVQALKAKGYTPSDYYHRNAELKAVIDMIASGYFSSGDTEVFKPIVDSLLNHDEYLLLADYQAYIDIQDEIAEAYRDTEQWTRMSILNAARCGYFSSDRTIRQYCDDIWQVESVEVKLEQDTD
jgi:starch phosphorylase